MICEKCRHAAGLLKNADAPGTPGHAKVVKIAGNMHAQCTGGSWCDCQHVIAPAPEEPFGHHSSE